MRVAVQRGAVVAPSSREKRQMGACVCVNVLCGIVKESLKKTSLFFPLKEKDIFIEEIKREKGEGNNLSRV